jgi:orotidine-5'-phosphate decarboxylase
MSFGVRLAAALVARGPLCVGIDPHPELLAAWGLGVDVAGLARFTERCVEAFGDDVAVVKPQSAFFERFGSAGIAVLERTVAQLRERGALVVLDVKRGDIGSTMDAYAAAYLDPDAPLFADAITLSPYLGVDTLEPAFALADQHDAGAFVLALTSNPEGPQVQRAVGTGGRSVAQIVVDELAARNEGGTPLGSLGVVIGATIGSTDLDLSKLNGPILVPGLGAQGGSAADVKRILGDVFPSVVPSVSREVLRQGPRPEVLRSAARRLLDDFAFLRG